MDLGPFTLSSLEKSYPQHQAEIKPQGDDRTLLVLKHQSNPDSEINVMIDTRRHVMLWIEHRQAGKITSATRCEDFVEAGGVWWPGRIETFDSENRRTSRSAQQFKPIAIEAQEQQIAKELAPRDKIQFLREPAPKLAAAKQAIASGKAAFDDQIVLLLHYAQSQQWTRAREYLDNAEKLCENKPGVRWMQYAFLNVSRHREELKLKIMAEAEKLAKQSADDLALSDQLALASHFISQSSGILEANEMLALLDTLKPVFERQPQYMLGLKQWNQQRVNYLRQTGRSDEVLALQKQLAQGYPHEIYLQQQYAQDLVNYSGDYESAYAWLAKAIADNDRRLPNEDEQLRNSYCQFLEQEGRLPDLVEYLSAWTKKNPQGTLAYQRYLSTLIKLGRMDEAYSTMESWLKGAQISGRLPPETASKLHAAVQQALGQGYNLNADRIDERWLDPLADAALFFAKHQYQQSTASDIMNNWRFMQSDQCRKVRKAAADILKAEMDKLPPAQIQLFVNWIMSNDPVVEKDVWKRLADELHKRWAAENDQDEKNRLAGMLNQVLQSRIGQTEYLAFLREQLEKAPEENKPGCAAALFNAILTQPCSVERENEVFSLLDKQSDAEEP